ncbi:MAG: shikimate dehydrogenase [Lachnospiraceae bacterium]|nr:shikimate dehydrogenase [Lachnospiraceae bacterium]
MNINGKTTVFGIIGDPIEHTMSPFIHNIISRAVGIDAVYVPFRANGDMVNITKGLYALGVKGINVTVPYKTKIIPQLYMVEEVAQRIGAVNTLKYTEEGYKGYNTDILGLDRELIKEGISLDNRNVVILGAGGAARAVAFMCAGKAVSSITIVNRTLAKAESIKESLVEYLIAKGNFSLGEKIYVMTAEELKQRGEGGYVAFQCTNVGLSPKVDECVICDEAFYEKVEIGIDLIYKPARTRFMKYVEEAGGRAFNGLRMLIYQAVCSYEIWNDIKVPDEVVGLIEEKMLK